MCPFDTQIKKSGLRISDSKVFSSVLLNKVCFYILEFKKNSKCGDLFALEVSTYPACYRAEIKRCDSLLRIVFINRVLTRRRLFCSFLFLKQID